MGVMLQSFSFTIDRPASLRGMACNRRAVFMPSDSKKLLIVDDDNIVRQGVVVYLQDSGFEVLEASDGHKALALVASENPSVVLTDLKMPNMDGLQLLEHIHKLSVNTPVIVMSGVGVIGDVVHALRLGASDFLIKPLVDMEVLVHAINKCVERSELLAQNQHYRSELLQANHELKDHLRTLERDQQAGRRVQQQLLPPTPVYRGEYRVEHKVIPSLFLSGDFVDLAFTSDRYLAFYLIDVAGHGASSAFVTIWMKHVATEILQDQQLFCREEELELDLDTWLQEVNRRLLDSRLGAHMTCLVGVVDTARHRLHYAVAGHLPLPVLMSEGQANFLQGKGLPLGLFSDYSWTISQVDFPPGSALMSFSDGVLEVMPAKELIEKEELLLQYLNDSGPEIDNVRRALKLDQLEEAPDDIAILSIFREANSREE